MFNVDPSSNTMSSHDSNQTSTFQGDLWYRCIICDLTDIERARKKTTTPRPKYIIV